LFDKAHILTNFLPPTVFLFPIFRFRPAGEEPTTSGPVGGMMFYKYESWTLIA
jgi:hypothetical protein